MISLTDTLRETAPDLTDAGAAYPEADIHPPIADAPPVTEDTISTALRVASMLNPADAARALASADATGMPPELAYMNIANAETLAKQVRSQMAVAENQGVNVARLLRDTPETARLFSDAARAAALIEYRDALARGEKVLSRPREAPQWGDSARNIISGALSLTSTGASFAQVAAETLTPGQENALSRPLGALASGVNVAAEFVRPPEHRQNFTGTLMQGFGTMLPLVGAALVAPAFAPLATVAAGVGAVRQSAEEQGFDVRSPAGQIATLVGGAGVGSLDLLGVNAVLSRVFPNAVASALTRAVAPVLGRSVGGRIAAAGATEATTEGLQQFVQNFAEQQAYGSTRSLTYGVEDNAAAGAGVGVMMASVVEAAMGIHNRRTRALTALTPEQNQQFATELIASAQDPQTKAARAADPAGFAAHAEASAGGTTIYISPEPMRAFYQALPEDSRKALDAAVPGIREQLDEGAEAPVAVPSAEFYSHVAPAQSANELAPHITTNLDVLTAAEMQQAEAFRADFAKAEAAVAEGNKAVRAAIREDAARLETQMREAGLASRQARDHALIMAYQRHVISSRAGVTVEELSPLLAVKQDTAAPVDTEAAKTAAQGSRVFLRDDVAKPTYDPMLDAAVMPAATTSAENVAAFSSQPTDLSGVQITVKKEYRGRSSSVRVGAETHVREISRSINALLRLQECVG